MKLWSSILITFCLLISGTLLSQEETTIDVNKDISITKVYEQVIKEGYGTPKVYLDLANAHYFKNNHAQAKKWFEKLFEVEKPTDETLKFRYKQTLKALNVPFAANQYLSAVDGGSN